ncbi:hypothetical protein NEUTE2DRAFT_58019 [Neurospora tetrasperma FGSC 2509]|nr:hypothetical protein NEUTE2DRAFT_58019 [Neurospora tetrasperma FGSC 2509]
MTTECTAAVLIVSSVLTSGSVLLISLIQQCQLLRTNLDSPISGYDIQEIVLALQAAAGISTVHVTRTIQDVIQYAERVNPGSHSKFTLTQQPLKDERFEVNKFRFSLFPRLEDNGTTDAFC